MLTETNKNYYNAPRSDTFEIGAQFVDFVVEQMLKQRGVIIQPYQSRKNQFEKGESIQGWEIKYDERFTETKRLSIEIAEKANHGSNQWTPSGIYRQDNSWIYVQGNFQCFYIFGKNVLMSLHRSGKYEEAESHGTIRKFYLPISEADKFGEKITP